MTRFAFDLTSIPPADMKLLTEWLMTRLRQFTPFCLWAIHVFGTEAERRIAGVEATCVPEIVIPQWTDDELATCLEASTLLGMARSVDDATTGRLVDLIQVHVAAMAAKRLRSRAPVERN